MPEKKPFLLYLRSRLNLTVAGCAAVCAVLVFFTVPSYGPGALALLAAAYAVVTAFLFFSRRGASQVVGEVEEDRLKAVRGKIARSAEARERIAVLRVGDPEMAKVLEYFLLVSGEYLDACRELDTWSPAASAEIEKVLELCQIFLGEADETSTERRYAVKDGGPFPAYAERTVAAVRESAATVKERTATDVRGLTRGERMDVIEETEGKE